MRGDVADSDLAIVQQLRRVTRDVLIALSASTLPVATQIAKARAGGGLDAVVTSPTLGEADTLELIGALREADEPLAILPVVRSARRGARFVSAGADASLVLVDGVLTNPDEILRCVKRRLRAAERPGWVRNFVPTVIDVSRRALLEIGTLQDRLATPKPVEPITVQVVRRVDEELVQAAARLVPQLRASAPGPWELEQIVRHPGATLLIAREGQIAVGMLMLVVVRGPAGIRAWIEDLVVDQAARGRGVGTLLTEEAMRVASRSGARSVQLSCPPSRPGPNRAYQRLGFERRETNLYRFRMSG